MDATKEIISVFMLPFEAFCQKKLPFKGNFFNIVVFALFDPVRTPPPPPPPVSGSIYWKTQIVQKTMIAIFFGLLAKPVRRSI